MAELHPTGREPSTVAMFAYLMIGPILWALHLLFVYGAHTLVCSLGGTPATSTVVLMAGTVAAATPLVPVLALQRRTGRFFGIGDDLADRQVYDSISRVAGILSLAGIVWSGVAVAMLSSCAQGR